MPGPLQYFPANEIALQYSRCPQLAKRSDIIVFWAKSDEYPLTGPIDLRHQKALVIPLICIGLIYTNLVDPESQSQR
jgi:hypothetical protein